MQFALILDTNLATDAFRRKRLIDAVSHISGVLRVDTEMAESGLLLADLAASADASLLARVDGIEAVEGMDAKGVLIAR